MKAVPDFVQDFLEKLISLNQMDPGWCLTEPGRVSYWPGVLAQRIWVGERREDEGVERVEIHAETDLAREVEPSVALEQKLSGLSAFAALNAWVYHPEERVVRLHAKLVIDAQSHERFLRLFSLATTLQAARAHALLELDVPEALDGVPDVSGHPERGVRDAPDELLSLVEGLIAPQGREGSLYGVDDFAGIGLIASRVCREHQIGDEVVVAEIRVHPDEESELVALFQATPEARHPDLGSGCLLTLEVPSSSRSAAELARLETTTWTGFSMLGAWHDGETHPTFVTYLPNIVHGPGLFASFFMLSALRTWWWGRELS